MYKLEEEIDAKWIRVSKVMEMLDVGKTRVYALLKNKDIFGKKIGRSTRISYQSVIEYINNCPTY